MLRKILEFDYRASSRLRLPEKRGVLRSLTVFFAHSGDSWFWLAALFLIWLLDKGEWHTRAALLTTGVLGLAVLVLAVKFTVRRRRPAGEWGAIYRNTDPHSFPIRACGPRYFPGGSRAGPGTAVVWHPAADLGSAGCPGSGGIGGAFCRISWSG